MHTLFRIGANIGLVFLTVFWLLLWFELWRTGRLGLTGCNPAERAALRRMSVIVLASLAVVWMAAVSTVALWPGLVRLPALANDVATNPLQLTAFMLIVTYPSSFGRLKKSLGLRAAMSLTLFICACMVAAAGLTLIHVRMTHFA